MASKNSGAVWIIAAAVAVLLIGGGTYWIIHQSSQTQQKKTASDKTSQQADHGASATVTIVYGNSGFPSETFMVKAGGAVTVKNDSNHDLEFSSGPHPTHTEETELNMGVLHPGESGSFKVTKVGTWGFHNHFKEEDTGSLMVM